MILFLEVGLVDGMFVARQCRHRDDALQARAIRRHTRFNARSTMAQQAVRL
jgi:hypothetical protein